MKLTKKSVSIFFLSNLQSIHEEKDNLRKHLGNVIFTLYVNKSHASYVTSVKCHNCKLF